MISYLIIANDDCYATVTMHAENFETAVKHCEWLAKEGEKRTLTIAKVIAEYDYAPSPKPKRRLRMA